MNRQLAKKKNLMATGNRRWVTRSKNEDTQETVEQLQEEYYNLKTRKTFWCNVHTERGFRVK